MLKAASVLVNLVDYCSALFLVSIKVRNDTNINGGFSIDGAPLSALQKSAMAGL